MEKKFNLESFSTLNFFKISIKRIGWRLFLITFAALLASIIEIFGIGLIVPFFELISGNKNESSKFTQLVFSYFDNLNLEYNYVSILILLSVTFSIKAVLVFITNYIQVWVVANINKNIQVKLVNLVENSKFFFLFSERQGRFLNLISREGNRYSNAIQKLSSSFVNLISVIIFSLTIFYIYPSFIIYVFVLILFLPILLKLLKATRKYSFALTENYSRSQSFFLELMKNFIYLKSTNATNRLEKVIKEKLSNLEKISLKSGAIGAFLGVIKEPIGVIVISFIIYSKVVKEGFPISEILVIAILFYRVIQKVIDIFQLWQKVNMDMGGVFEVEKSIFQLEENQEENNGKETVKLNKPIIFRDVNFKYKNRLILENVNFSIDPYKTTAIIGPSGSGKSTLLYLLTKLISPTKGSISINGKNYFKINTKNLRSKIGYITQDISLFYGTILENISLWQNKEDNDLKKTYKVLKDSGCLELKNRLDDEVGDFGNKLSGGQKQRLAIARELFKDPDLLIFDEATSSLDSYNEKIVRDTIQKLKKKKTIIIVSHKLTSIKNADKIIVISQGRVIEQGKFKDLLTKKNGFLKNLYLKENVKKIGTN